MYRDNMDKEEEKYAYGKCLMNLEGKRFDVTSFVKARDRCPCCGMTKAGVVGFDKSFSYTIPDQYQKQVGVDGIEARRAWKKCCRCGLFIQEGALRSDQASKLYTNGYRSVKMRNASVMDEFRRIREEGQSENSYRVNWILRNILPKSILDIGSGLGLFPFEMRQRLVKPRIDCFEPNSDSYEFISNNLGIRCVNDFYRPNVFKQTYDLVSLVHVLEHVHKPVELLNHVKLDMDKWLYIEVPDSVSFEYLKPDHDEFNSTHQWFFSPEHLIALVKRCGLVVDMLHTVTTERGLSRIMVLAKKRDRCSKTES